LINITLADVFFAVFFLQIVFFHNKDYVKAIIKCMVSGCSVESVDSTALGKHFFVIDFLYFFISYPYITKSSAI